MNKPFAEKVSAVVPRRAQLSPTGQENTGQERNVVPTPPNPQTLSATEPFNQQLVTTTGIRRIAEIDAELARHDLRSKQERLRHLIDRQVAENCRDAGHPTDPGYGDRCFCGVRA